MKIPFFSRFANRYKRDRPRPNQSNLSNEILLHFLVTTETRVEVICQHEDLDAWKLTLEFNGTKYTGIFMRSFDWGEIEYYRRSPKTRPDSLSVWSLLPDNDLVNRRLAELCVSRGVNSTHVTQQV